MPIDAIDLLAPTNKPQRPFFAKASGRSFQARTENGATIIDIFDEIGPFGVDTADVEAKLRDAGDVVVRINSPGGDLWSGLAIFNLLAKHAANVRIEILGVAASAASIIAMAGDTIAIADNAFIMIHRAWGMTVGNVSDHNEAAALLEKVDAAMASTYAKRSGQTLAVINAMMIAESWLDADAAIEADLADEKLESSNPKAQFDLSIYAKAPAELAGEIDQKNPTIRDIEIILRDAGFSRSQAKALAAHGHHGDEDQQRDAADIAHLAAHIHAAANSIQI